MRTKVRVETHTTPAAETSQTCYCGKGRRGQSCAECEFVPCDEQTNFEVGTIWERVTTSKHGSATYSYEAGNDEMEERRFLGALRRAVGHTVSVAYGHYGYAPKTGGLNPEGTYEIERI